MFSLPAVSPNIDGAVKLKVSDQLFFSIAEFESNEAKQTLFRRRELTAPCNNTCLGLVESVDTQATWIPLGTPARRPLTSAGTAS